uniref:DUF6252 family protein n=1 Tax=Flavobacterium sp. TaxID=239 RepID=UPI00404B84F2
MRNILFLLVGLLSLSGCVNDIQTNTPALQAKFKNKTWRAKEAYVEVDNNGLTITAFTGVETLVLKTAAALPGTYVLGTTNQSNFISYDYSTTGLSLNYDTSVYFGPVYKMSTISNAGTGYVTSSNVATVGGSGSGLRLDIVASATGAVTQVTIVARGNGYKSGDIINIVGGVSNNASVRVLNVQQSNGEIVIEEVENGAFTGTFKFNAVNSDTGEVTTFSNGVFYKLSSAGL